MFSDILKQVRPALVATVVLTIVTGLIYPLAVTAVSQTIFPHQANGSVIMKNGKPIGSTLIGQPFSAPKYFWERLSATGAKPYDAASSGGSNLGPTNSALMDAVKGRIKDLKDADPDAKEPIPVDLVTASGSGLDPDITPAAVEYQIHRVAVARRIDEDELRGFIKTFIRDRQFGILGEPRVNVLELNIALDDKWPSH